MKTIKIIGKVVLGVVIGLAVLAALGYVLTFGEYDVLQTVAQDSALPHITANGHTLHAETFGDPANPVVIAIHGGPGGDYRSLLNLQELADQYFVVFYDQLGGGLSPRVDPGDASMDSVLAELDAIVDLYGKGEKVNLVGHSWGAMVASMYIGQHPDKVDHVVLAEPGFLTTEFAEAFLEETQIKMNFSVLYHFLKTQFESLHVKGPDDDAANDYFAYQFSMYQGAGHPQAGYRCEGAPPEYGKSWRYGARAAGDIQNEAIDEQGNIDVSFIEGVERFTNKVLFMSGACQTIIGPEWQTEQMAFFPDAELVVIPDAGHEMFDENSEASIAAVRDYLNTPVE